VFYFTHFVSLCFTPSYFFCCFQQQWQCPVNPSARGVTITLPIGVVATLRLSPDYPRSSGAVVVEALNGIENWRDSDLALLCDDLNKTQWHTLAQLLGVLNARLTHMASK
jgi:hypothetical protein